MRNHSLRGFKSLAGILLLLVLGQAAATPGQDTLKVGKEGTVTLSSVTTVGGFRLEPGSYKVSCEHLETGDHHLVFVRVVRRNPYSSVSTRKTPDIVKVTCAMEVLPLTTRQTEMVLAVSKSGERSIRRILIRGENVSHEFPALTKLPLVPRSEPKDTSDETPSPS